MYKESAIVDWYTLRWLEHYPGINLSYMPSGCESIEAEKWFKFL